MSLRENIDAHILEAARRACRVPIPRQRLGRLERAARAVTTRELLGWSSNHATEVVPPFVQDGQCDTSGLDDLRLCIRRKPTPLDREDCVGESLPTAGHLDELELLSQDLLEYCARRQ